MYIVVFINTSIPLDFDNKLILHYPFNNDILNYSTAIGMNDSTLFGSINLSTTVKIVGNTSLYNPDNQSYLSIKNSNVNTTTGFTISFWIYTDDINTINSNGFCSLFFTTTTY